MIDVPEDFDFHVIDKYKLDEEWEQQPRLFRHYSEKLANAERNHRLAETSLELVEAEVELVIRKDTVSAGLEKGTEGEIKKAVIVNKEVRKAKRDEIDAHHKVDILKAAVRTLEHRKAGIQDLVQLWMGDYFSKPRIKGDAGSMMRDRKIDHAFNRGKKAPRVRSDD